MTRSHLVCYAAGANVHLKNRDRLVASALRQGIDNVLACGPDDIAPSFRAAHAELFAGTDGAGYWLWKPYLIAKAMEAAADGDIILYIDSGAFLRRRPHALWQGAPDADVIFFQNDYRNRLYVKRDAFVLTDTDVEACHDSLQLDAAILIFRKTEASMRLVHDWLQACSDPRMLTDVPNACGKPNLPGFIAHRHDQALLSLLMWKERSALKAVFHRRSRKHLYVTHHRRRSAAMPIWLWHGLHDGPEAALRRVWDTDFGRGRRGLCP